MSDHPQTRSGSAATRSRYVDVGHRRDRLPNDRQRTAAASCSTVGPSRACRSASLARRSERALHVHPSGYARARRDAVARRYALRVRASDRDAPRVRRSPRPRPLRAPRPRHRRHARAASRARRSRARRSGRDHEHRRCPEHRPPWIPLYQRLAALPMTATSFGWLLRLPAVSSLDPRVRTRASTMPRLLDDDFLACFVAPLLGIQSPSRRRHALSPWHRLAR